jgi:hypothetical protein
MFSISNVKNGEIRRKNSQGVIRRNLQSAAKIDEKPLRQLIHYLRKQMFSSSDFVPKSSPIALKLIARLREGCMQCFWV